MTLVEALTAAVQQLDLRPRCCPACGAGYGTKAHRAACAGRDDLRGKYRCPGCGRPPLSPIHRQKCMQRQEAA